MHHVTRNPIILLYLPFYNQHITKVTFLKCIKIHLRIVVSGGTAIVPRDGDNDSLYQFPYINMPGINEHKYIIYLIL